MNASIGSHRRGRRERRSTPNCTAKITKEGTTNAEGFRGFQLQSSCLVCFFASLVPSVVEFSVDGPFSAGLAVRAGCWRLCRFADAWSVLCRR